MDRFAAHTVEGSSSISDVDTVASALGARRSALGARRSALGAQRSVPVPPALVDMISASLASRRRADGSLAGEHLWTDPHGRRLLGTVVDSEVRRIERNTGLTFSPHHPRRYYGASLISHGVPIRQGPEQMGHASLQVTMRVYAYAMTDDAAKGRAAAAEVATLSAPRAPNVHRRAAAGE